MAFNLFDLVKQDLGRTDIDQDNTMPDVPLSVELFLGRLGLLQNVPLYNIIPSEKYIPVTTAGVLINGITETVECGALKLFWLDKEWVECLLNGALSVGPCDGSDLLMSKAMAGNYVAQAFYEDTKEKIKKQIGGLYGPDEFKAQLNSRLAASNIKFLSSGQPAPTAAQSNWCYTGFFMRSSIISAWKGVEIVAEGNDTNENSSQGLTSTVRPLQVVRFDRLAPDTIFCICEGIVSMVEITQPAEAIHFALKEQGGVYTAGAAGVTAGMRTTPGVINIADMALAMGAANSADFARNMIARPLKVKLTVSWTPKKP